MNSTNAVRFDQKVSNIEDFLSMGAAVPVAGTIPGLLKVALGAIQLVSAAFVLLWSKASKDVSLQKRAWMHIQHGAGNMGAGTCEAIPVVGTILGLMRLSKMTGSHTFESTQRSKFMPYASIWENDRKSGPPAPLPSNDA